MLKTVLWKRIPPIGTAAHAWQWLSKSMKIGLWIHFWFIQWNLLQQSGTFSSLSLERPSLFTWWLQRSPINSWRPNAKIWRRAGTPRCHLRPHEKLQRSLGTPWSLKRPHGKFLRWSGRPWYHLLPGNSSLGAGVEALPETRQISALKEIQKHMKNIPKNQGGGTAWNTAE